MWNDFVFESKNNDGNNKHNDIMLDTLYAVLRYEKEQLQKILHAPVGVCVCVFEEWRLRETVGGDTQRKRKRS